MEVIAWNFTKELSKARSLSRESDGSLDETAATGDGLEGSLWLKGVMNVDNVRLRGDIPLLSV